MIVVVRRHAKGRVDVRCDFASNFRRMVRVIGFDEQEGGDEESLGAGLRLHVQPFNEVVDVLRGKRRLSVGCDVVDHRESLAFRWHSVRKHALVVSKGGNDGVQLAGCWLGHGSLLGYSPPLALTFAWARDGQSFALWSSARSES